MTVVTRKYITDLLRTNDTALARALVALNARQTQDEQQDAATRWLNGKGFMPMHANRGTGMAKFFLARGYLTQKQLDWWRKPTASGKARIEKYVSQLLLVAKENGREVER